MVWGYAAKYYEEDSLTLKVHICSKKNKKTTVIISKGISFAFSGVFCNVQ